MIKALVVGMGNPSLSWTPHNIGSDLLKIAFSLEKNEVLEHEIQFLLEPSQVNVSGIAIAKYIKKKNISNLIVVVDDIDTAPGKIVCSFGKSHRGHNGIRNIIEMIGKDFWKVRIGVGKKEDVQHFVLRQIDNREPFLNCVDLLRQTILNLVS